MTQPSAKIIADSITEQGHRLTTMEVVMHRFVLAEMNTHRAFSRNSASSRAIPYEKIRNRVLDDHTMPVKWASEQKGMQGGDELDGELLMGAQHVWHDARSHAVNCADVLHELGLHKSLVNRLLEPFMWHTAIITATEWDNFFWQRCHPDAQPEMKVVADSMQFAYYTSRPKVVTHGEWHLPYIEQRDIDILYEGRAYHEVIDILRRVSVARCARVSYLTQDGKRDMSKDDELFERLLNSGHWSPFEHVATPIVTNARVPNNPDTGNFVGWRQFRKEFSGENRTGFIPNLPELAHVAELISEVG
jgi:thymidylate synthase ThyX